MAARRRRPFGVEGTDGFDRVPRETKPAGKRCLDVRLSVGLRRDREPEAAIEGKRLAHVGYDQTNDVDSWSHRVRVCTDDRVGLVRNGHVGKASPQPELIASACRAGRAPRDTSRRQPGTPGRAAPSAASRHQTSSGRAPPWTRSPHRHAASSRGSGTSPCPRSGEPNHRPPRPDASGGVTRLTRPRSRASSASNGRQVMTSSLVAAGPISRTSRGIPPQASGIPRSTSGMEKRVPLGRDPQIAGGCQHDSSADAVPVQPRNRHCLHGFDGVGHAPSGVRRNAG